MDKELKTIRDSLLRIANAIDQQTKDLEEINEMLKERSKRKWQEKQN